MDTKPHKFFITGLPRSRTAWMSTFLTHGNSFCYHDASEKISDIKQIESLYESSYYKHMGIADSGMGFFIEWILENVQPRTLIIERDPKEVLASMKRLGLPETNILEVLQARLEKFKEHPLVMWVPYEALNSKRVMQKIFWHLQPGESFDEMHYELLAKMNIQCEIVNMFKRVENSRDSMSYLLRDVIPLLKVKEAQNAQKCH